jgi:hypothetical protein
MAENLTQKIVQSLKEAREAYRKGDRGLIVSTLNLFETEIS